MTIGPNLTEVNTTPYFRVGEEYCSALGAVYKYVKAVTAITAKQVATIDKDSEASAGSGTTAGSKPQNAGIAQATLAANEYGWLAIGPFPEAEGIEVSSLANCAAEVELYTTATAGSVDDSASGQKKINGLGLGAANGGSTANVACYATDRLTVN